VRKRGGRGGGRGDKEEGEERRSLAIITHQSITNHRNTLLKSSITVTFKSEIG
jgi:hypothetical protein